MLYNNDMPSPKDAEIIRNWLTPLLDTTRGGTQNKALAEHCGVTPQAVSGWKTTGRISKSNLQKAVGFFRSAPMFEGGSALTAQETFPTWPFPDIPASRWHRLSANQRIEIQGIVRERIERFESSAGSTEVASHSNRKRRA